MIPSQDANWAGLPMGSPNPIGFGPVLVMAFLLGALRALPPGGSNWVVQSRSCILAPEQTQVPRCPQVPRRRVNNFQLANVMEPQSRPPAPKPAPDPGSDAGILVDDPVSNAPATRPASVAPKVPTGSMIVPGKHQTRRATRRQPAGSMSRSWIWYSTPSFNSIAFAALGPHHFTNLLVIITIMSSKQTSLDQFFKNTTKGAWKPSSDLFQPSGPTVLAPPPPPEWSYSCTAQVYKAPPNQTFQASAQNFSVGNQQIGFVGSECEELDAEYKRAQQEGTTSNLLPLRHPDFRKGTPAESLIVNTELVPPGEFKRQYQKKDLGSLQQGTPQGTLADQEALHASVRGGGLGSHDSAEGTSNRDSLHPREEDRQNEPACGNGGLESVHGPPPKGESTSGKQESSGSTQRQPSVNELFKLEKLHRFNSVKHRRPFNSLLQEFLNCKFNSAHSQLVKDP
ncbi:hypothetical protein PCASD_13353 [Puccinia coronata f. sp. avenae]|uniref:Uncharacterized protein n=1 Tax=Puccinia coronata f. sp. avenae TaxID=200324 RepID=A0A2N5U4G4_9BASI|nr:hypothetical protein PCASD_13353 [Puccinia coronata f. sp. avenae]